MKSFMRYHDNLYFRVCEHFQKEASNCGEPSEWHRLAKILFGK